MTLEEYGIDYKKIPNRFWLRLARKYERDDYEWWCCTNAFKNPNSVKSAFQYFWSRRWDTEGDNPYKYLQKAINACLKKQEEVPAFIQELRNAK